MSYGVINWQLNTTYGECIAPNTGQPKTSLIQRGQRDSAQTFSGTLTMEQGYFLVQTPFAFSHRYQQDSSTIVGVSSSTDYFNSVLPSPKGTDQNLTQKKSWRLRFWGSVDLS